MSRKNRQLGVVMDPIAGINPKKDSTLAMLLAAAERGWELIYFEQRDLAIRDGRPEGTGRVLEVHRSLENWFTFGEPREGPLERLDALLMRKDPPFDMEFVYTTYILELAELAGVLIVNRPASLRDINEKVATAWFPQCTPPSLISRSRTALLEFLAEHHKVVFKPLAVRFVAEVSNV